MDIKEMSYKIRDYCRSRSCEGCPLCDFDETDCYNPDLVSESVIERNYKILFPESVVAFERVEEDLVNHPSHYTSGGIECIDAIAASMTPDEYAGFLKGQVIKYVWRYRLKGKPLEDLKKARFYLERLISSLEQEATV